MFQELIRGISIYIDLTINQQTALIYILLLNFSCNADFPLLLFFNRTHTAIWLPGTAEVPPFIQHKGQGTGLSS